MGEKVPDISYAEWKAIYVGGVPRGLSAGNKFYPTVEGTPPTFKGKLPNLTLIENTLNYFEGIIVNAPIENAVIITASGDVYHCTGDLNGLTTIEELGDKLRGAIMTHNHPLGSDNEYSFSDDDISLFQMFRLARLRGIDEKFVYEMDYNLSDIDEIPSKLDDEQNLLPDENMYNGRHRVVVIRALNEGFGYRRRSR